VADDLDAPVIDAAEQVDELPVAGNNTPWVLDEDLAINFVQKIKDMLDKIPVAQELVIDCSNIKTIDTAGVQLLLSFQRTRTTKGASLRWIGTDNEVLTSIVELLGLTNSFQFTNNSGQDYA
jgi:anti-anti-sigma regulatory factor